MKPQDVNALAAGPKGMDKERFHRLGRSYLKVIAAEMGLPAGSYEIRSNKGATAVMGEVVLHTDRVYVHLTGDTFGDNRFYYRSCKGRKDYTGGRNRWMDYSALADVSGAAAVFVQTMDLP